RHSQYHRHAAAPPIADLGGVVDELIEAGRDEIVELDLADRPLSGERRANAHAENGPFREGSVENSSAKLIEQRAKQQERIAVPAADIFAEHEDTRVGTQRIG